MNEKIELLLTVSGGLEDLAEKQVRSRFRDDLLQVGWHRGSSGSQLYITLDCYRGEATMVSKIANCLQRLDYVEYVYVLLHSMKINTLQSDVPQLLQQMKTEMAKIPQTSIDFAARICDLAECSMNTSDRVGLEGLPGVLLNPSFQEMNESLSSPLPCQDFDVNTIYTKSWVAKVVVETVQAFCSQYSDANESSIWLDAGSGNGALLDYLPEASSIGVDTCPTSSRVQQMDFLEVSQSWLYSECSSYESLFVISNPPFSLSSRGDYTPIVQFINHSFDKLDARMVAVICPSKFARKRIWKSLEMTANANLLGRFFLPQDAFFNPSNGKAVHIHSYCLIFGRYDQVKRTDLLQPKAGVYLSAKRDKGCFPKLSTLDLTKALVSGFDNAGGSIELAAERHAKYMLHAKLSSSLELWWHINPQRPCSLMNSNSIKIPNHSLGWISLSCKPGIAMAMSSIALPKEPSDQKGHIAVNLMSGEGTIELEANRAFGNSFFMIGGDKSFDRALMTRKRLQSSNKGKSQPLVDVVIWDAQRLPLRKGIADAVLADLPFQGSIKKAHQEPTVGSNNGGGAISVLNYSKVLSHACRILKPKGYASLLSPDFKALRHASAGFHWSPIWFSKSVNLGGLSGKLFLMQRQEACTKDVSMWVLTSTKDMSEWILCLARKTCATECDGSKKSPLVTNVQLHSTFFHDQKKSHSHCYRISFDDEIKNVETTRLEKKIRLALEKNLQPGMSLR